MVARPSAPLPGHGVSYAINSILLSDSLPQFSRCFLVPSGREGEAGLRASTIEARIAVADLRSRPNPSGRLKKAWLLAAASIEPPAHSASSAPVQHRRTRVD